VLTDWLVLFVLLALAFAAGYGLRAFISHRRRHWR
jgi:flagellar biogenesis protein FliO